MRRGLISWSPEEMPVAVLDRRVARLQAAMRTENIGAVLVYTSFAQPSAVHWLSNFTPYWSEALAVVLPQGAPVLLAALTKRVHVWIKEVSHFSEVLMAPRPGVEAVKFLEGKIANGHRIGIVAMDSLPWTVAQPLVDASPAGHLVDVSAMFAALRQPGDAEEHALFDRAARIAAEAFASVPPAPVNVSDVTSAIEASARLAGAEEVLLRFAPDLGSGAVLQRMEGDASLGMTYAVEVSVAYKGVWIRLARSLGRTAPPASWKAAQAWFANVSRRLGESLGGRLPIEAPGQLLDWTLQATLGSYPLSVVAANGVAATAGLPTGSHAVFSVQLSLADGPWYAAIPIVIGAPGQPGN